MPGWKSAVVALLALAGSALSHPGHHDDGDVLISESQREELLKKWNQEVFILVTCSMSVNYLC